MWVIVEPQEVDMIGDMLGDVNMEECGKANSISEAVNIVPPYGNPYDMDEDLVDPDTPNV